MATIQRTFKDPALQNPLKYLGYDSIPVEIEDGGTSENYFNVQGIGSELHAGKNIFYIKPDSETLVDNAEIGVEVLDANGDLVPVRLLDNRKSDGSIGLVIEVDETRPKGYGQITLVSVARGQVIGARLQPLRNTDNFNIRWAKRVYLNRDGLNTSEITYISPPSIEVAELKLPYYISHFNTELTASLSSALTSANPTIVNEITCSIYQLSSSFNTAAKISYEKQREQIYLELTGSDFGGFVSDMENGTLFFDASNIVGIEPSAATLNTRVEDGDGFDDIASEGSYFTSILQVLSPTRMLVSSPHTTFQGSGQNLHEVMHQTFQPSNFTLTWAMPPYSHSRYPDNEGDDTKYLTSYAGIQVSNLDPYSGDVHRIKTYVRAESRPDDYVMCSDLVVESQELLIVSESEHYNKIRFKNIPCGKFDRLNSSPESSDVRYFANYWTSSAVGLDAPSLTIVSRSYSTDDNTDFVPMRPSLRVGTLGEVSPLDDNVGRDTSQPMKTVELKSTVSASFKQDKVYVLEVSGYVKGRDLLTTSGKNSGVVHGIGSFTVGLGSKQPFKVNSDTPQYPWSYLQGGVIAGKGVTNPFTIAEGPNLSAPRLDIFGFGEAFQDDTNRLGQGKLIGEINDAPQPQGSIVDVKKIEGYSGVDHVLEVNLRFPFKADANAVGEFRFEIERGLWYFQEISVKPYHRDGVTPHQYDYLVPLPRGLSHPERRDVFDFMFEFYNIEGHMCAEKVYIDNICMDNEYTLAPTTVINESNELYATTTGSFTGSFTGEITGDSIINIDRSITINGGINTYIVGDTFIVGGNSITIFNGDVTHITNLTASHQHITQITESLNINNTYGDVLMYNSQSEEIGAIALGCGLGFMDKDNCCCHLHGDTNIYIFIDNTSMNIVNSNPNGGGASRYTPQLITKWVITKFEKDMRERYPYWKGNVYVGQGTSGPGSGTLPAERWLSWMSWPAVGNQRIDGSGIGQGITGSMSSVTWGEYPIGTTTNDESNGDYVGSDNFAAHGYSSSAYYLENSPIIRDGKPDSNVIVFAMVDETDPGTVAGPGKGYHYRDTLNGVAADFDNHLTDEYKMDYGLFIGKAYPAYDCFSGYVYALPSSNNITHAARQNFALHVYAAINDRVTSAEFIGATPTTGNLSAITGSNPYGHGSASVGTLSPWYQGAMFGLHSQSIGEKHDFAGGVAGWHDPFTYPVSVTNINRSGSWLHGQASFSADLFEFVDGDSIGVRVDAKTICINESNELYATNTGSFTGSFTGEITGDTILNIDRSITINGGINTYIVGDTFIIGGDNITVINTDVSYITNLTASNAFFHSMTASSATGNFSGSFTGSFDGDARLTGSFTGSFAGNLIGTASYGVDNDWYLQGGTADPTIDGDIYHTGKVGVGDFSSANITHTLTVLGDISASGTIYGKEFHTQYVSSSIMYMSGSTKFGDTTDDRADFTGSLQLSHSIMSIFTGSGKLAWGVDHTTANFTEDSTRIAQFYSGSSTGVTLNVTNWETASAFTEAGGITGDSSPAERGPRATISVNALNSSASYGYGGTRGIAGGSISYHPDTFEGNTNQDDIGDGGDTDSLGRRLLQEVLHIGTGGSPQGSINIHARGDAGQQIRFFTGGDDARNTGGKSIETQRMTIIHEGLVGIGTHNPQRRLHISESGHNYAASKGLVPLRVNDFYEGTGQHALIWDENTGDVYRKSLSEITATGGDSGIGVLTVGSTFIIGPFNTFINEAHFFGNITASGNISASDPNGIHIFGGSSTFHHITASGNISASDPNGIHILGGDVTLGVDCTDDLNIKATVTASCIISSSQDVVLKAITGSGTISMSGTGHNWFGGAINVTSIARDAQSNIPATIMGDDVSIIDGSLIVGERASQNGIPNNAIVGGAESLIVGQGNAVTNQNARSIVMGYYNSGSGLANFVGGSAGNKGLSDVTMVFGYGNHNEDNDGGIVLGSYNHISATSTNGHHAIGTRLVNSGSKGGSIVLGMNNTHGVTDAIFTIGDGHAYNQRRDLLVARSGSIEILGHVTQSGNISISGILEASQKSFVIPHPTKQGKKLVYGVLEGPEHAVYVRGKVDTNCIDLPEEWIGLVDEDSITVQLTPIGKHQNLYVEEIGNTKILIKNSNLLTKSINAFYFVQGTRKDIQALQTERDA